MMVAERIQIFTLRAEKSGKNTSEDTIVVASAIMVEGGEGGMEALRQNS